MEWYLVTSGKQNPYFNMALDEFLLSQYEKKRIPVLRIYGWRPFAISIGVNQIPKDVLFLERCNKERIPFVRRITGGSAIFHAEEISYSIVCSDDDINNKSGIKESYKILCSFIINLYKRLGLNAYYSIDVKDSIAKRGIGTFCFSSWEEYDIIVNGKKIGGNAQKRKKRIILQHGSIPLQLDFEKILYLIRKVPEDIIERSTSLFELTGRDISFQEMQSIMLEAFTTTFKIKLIKEQSGSKESIMIKNLINNKYKTTGWNFYKKIKEKIKDEQYD